MSKLTHAGRSIGTAIANPFVGGQFNLPGAVGPGQTGQPGGGQVQFSPEANARAQDIFKAIQGNQSGTYKEGQIATANSELKKLQQEYSSGKLSQADYVAISGAVVPQIKNYINQVSSSGGRGADAARNAGGDEFLNGVGRDYDILSNAQQILGRDITPQELAQFRPRYADGNDKGNAYLAEIQKQEASDPTKQGAKAGQYSPQVNQVFQSLLSRGATQNEVDYFGSLLSAGQITPYELESFAKATPEYQQGQDKQFRTDLSQELGNYDSKAFGREKENILSRYSQAGLQNSSALDFAMTDALSKIQENRDQYLSGLSASQYQGNKDAARGDYQTSLNRLFQNQDAEASRSNSQLDYLTQRADQGADYSRQFNDYMNFANSQPRQRTSAFDYLNAGLNTINTGANLYGAFHGAPTRPAPQY